ncbi:MAG: tRNA-binding protein [Bacteroidales bacterium]
MTLTATINDFEKLDIRAGKILRAEPFPEARKPAWKLTIDLGPGTGIKRSSARLTENYSIEELTGRTVLCVVNLPPRQIGPVKSEVLVLGLPDEEGNTVLVIPEREVTPGAKLY